MCWVTPSAHKAINFPEARGKESIFESPYLSGAHSSHLIPTKLDLQLHCPLSSQEIPFEPNVSHWHPGIQYKCHDRSTVQDESDFLNFSIFKKVGSHATSHLYNRDRQRNQPSTGRIAGLRSC